MRAVHNAGLIGMRRPLFFLATQCVQLDGLADLAGRIEHHVPSQAGDLAGTQSGLNRQQHHQLVAEWISGGGGKEQEVVYLLIVKYLGLLAGHLI